MELKQLKEIFNEIKSWDKSISSDMALDCSTRIYNSSNISKNKESEDKDDPRATSKQLNYLDKLGYEGTKDLSIKEAKTLIQEYLKNQGEI